MQELSKKIIIMTEDRLNYQETRHEMRQSRGEKENTWVCTSNAIPVNA